MKLWAAVTMRHAKLTERETGSWCNMGVAKKIKHVSPLEMYASQRRSGKRSLRFLCVCVCIDLDIHSSQICVYYYISHRVEFN